MRLSIGLLNKSARYLSGVVLMVGTQACSPSRVPRVAAPRPVPVAPASGDQRAVVEPSSAKPSSAGAVSSDLVAVECQDVPTKTELTSMIDAMLNARHFSQFLILKNPNAVPVRIAVDQLEADLGAAMQDVELEHFGEKVVFSEDNPHPSAISFERWDRSGDDLHVKTRFRVRNVAGVYQFRCQHGGWQLVKDTVHEYKPLPQ